MSRTGGSAAGRGLAGRCPACGEGRLFDGFLRLAPRCAICGAELAPPGGAEDPFALVVLAVGFLVVGAALLVEIRYAWPVWLHLVVWLPLALGLCLALLRPTRGLLVGIQYRVRRGRADDGG